MIRLATLLDTNETVQPHHLQLSTGGTSPLSTSNDSHPTPLAGLTLDQIEKEAIRQTLEKVNGHRAKAASLLGVSEKTIYNLLKRHQLS